MPLGLGLDKLKGGKQNSYAKIDTSVRSLAIDTIATELTISKAALPSKLQVDDYDPDLRSSPTSCPICHDFQPLAAWLTLPYGDFWRAPKPIGLCRIKDGPLEYRLMADLEDIESQASKGCQACSSLYEGYLRYSNVKKQDTYPNKLFQVRFEVALKPEASLLVRVFNYCNEVVCRFSIFTTPEYHPWDSLPDVPFDPSNRLGQGYRQLIQSWIQTCKDDHTQCASVTPLEMPKRLLRIRSNCSSIRLVEGIPTSESYAALSHCWKSSRPQKTTSFNFRERTKSILLSNLSPTLRDAVIVTRWLRVRYIWIDSLCIVQDDDNDWESQAAKMGTIFQNAYVTIAAHVDETTSIDNGFLGHHGVFKFNRSGAMNRDVFMRNSLQHTLSASYHNYYITDQLNQSAIVPLLQEGLWGRGWCFQERLLSSRVINFFPNEEIVFECFEGTRCECDDIFNHFEGWEDSTKRFSIKNSPVDGTAGPRLADLIKRSDGTEHQSQDHRKDLLRRLWSFIVDEYSSKNLSYCTDTLPALSSTANLMPRDMFGMYVAGLWKNQLVSDMAWHAKYPKAPRRRHPTYVAPTFSWASAAGPVYIGSEPWKACASVVEVNCLLHGTDPYGQVTSCAVTLYTRVCHFRVRREHRHVRRDGRKFSVWQSTALGNKHSETIVLEIDTDDDIDKIALDENLAIRLTKHLDGGRWSMFALYVTPSKNRDGAYERIGIIKWHCYENAKPHKRWFKGSEKRQILLI